MTKIKMTVTEWFLFRNCHSRLVFFFILIHILVCPLFRVKNAFLFQKLSASVGNLRQNGNFFSALFHGSEKLFPAEFFFFRLLQQNTELIAPDAVAVSVSGICLFQAIRDFL